MSRNIMRHVYGWLLLTPAAILLIAFTHYPTVATVFDSLFSKGSAIRPSRFVGLANYEMLVDDPIFWKVPYHPGIQLTRKPTKKNHTTCLLNARRNTTPAL